MKCSTPVKCGQNYGECLPQGIAQKAPAGNGTSRYYCYIEKDGKRTDDKECIAHCDCESYKDGCTTSCRPENSIE